MADHAAIATSLYEARRTRVPIAPPSETSPGLTAEDGYGIQQSFVSRLVAEGDRVVGYKLGLTSKPMQSMFNVDIPDHAPVMASFVYGDGGAVRAADFLQPRIEAEIALVLSDDLYGPDVSTVDVLRASAGAVAAVEVVDSRVADWKITLPDTIGDLASCGAVVLGGQIVPLNGFDLRLLGMIFSRGGNLVATGAGAAALGNPAAAVAWLVRTLHGYDAGLSAGQFVMTGALHAAVPIAAGEVWRAEFDRLGSVTARIV
ncbi:MAG: fumarylacetoacetate hydrolase family protein [Actinomycetota bacterium]|nr:fumarylacetoacetate hydrolase family protein [Actinomycetota bacterium]